jgi:phosphatidylserine decarboxylase
MTAEFIVKPQRKGIKESLILGLRIVPQNLISYLVGAIVRVQCPGFIQELLNRAFVGLFQINMAEAEKPLTAYLSIEDVFTRALAPNQRKVSGTYVASADGMLEMSRPVNLPGEAIQAKGLSYSLPELILGDKNGVINSSWYTTVYLAPHNYHRVHAPFSGRVTAVRYIPGRLWPVNRPAVRAVPGLFVKNERLVFDMELSSGGKAWVVMVGAFNVGRMSTRLLPDFVTNAVGQLFTLGHYGARELPLTSVPAVSAGDELGVFMLGSTTVVILDPKARDALSPKEILSPEKVSMGQSLSQ